MMTRFAEMLGRYVVETLPLWAVLLAVIFLGSFLFTRVERGAQEREKPNSHFGFGDALYFSFVTSLTVGYGDIVPRTKTGRVIALCNAALGITAMGVWVAVVVAALTNDGR